MTTYDDAEARMACGDRSTERTPTLRDQFAMAALTGLIAREGVAAGFESVCRRAYGWADAMMAEREVKR